MLRRNIVGRRVKALCLHWLQQASQFLRSASRRILLHMLRPRSARYMFAESHARESLDNTELHCKHDTIRPCSALTSSVFFLSTNADRRLLAGGGLCGKILGRVSCFNLRRFVLQAVSSPWRSRIKSLSVKCAEQMMQVSAYLSGKLALGILTTHACLSASS